MKKRSLLPLFLFSMIGLAVFFVNMDIRSHFHRFVKTKDNIVLYDKQHKKVATLYQGLTFDLEEKSKNNTYFKLNSLPYYVYYKDVEKETKKKQKEKKNYLVFNQNIKVAKNTVFYSLDNQRKIKLKKEMSIPIEYVDDQYYYVNYLDNLLKVKKKDGKLMEKKNTNKKEASYVSILHYEKIEENRKDNNSVESKVVEEQLETLDRLGYYLISIRAIARN